MTPIAADRQVSMPVAGRLEQIREIAGAVNATSDLPAILDQIVFATCHHSIWWTSGIMALNRSTGYSELVTRYAPPSAVYETLPKRWSLDTSPSRLAVERRQPIIIHDAQETTDYLSYRRDAIARDYHTVVVLSLNVSDAEGRDLVLAVHSKKKIEVTKEELDFLSTISHLAAIAVNKAKLVNVERAYSARLRGVLDLSAGLFQRVLEDGRMDAIAPLIEAALLHPIAVLDFTTDRVYAGRAPDSLKVTDKQWAELLQAEAYATLRHQVLSAGPSGFNTPFPLQLGAECVTARMEAIRIDGETVGGLVIFPVGRGVSDFDILIAQNAKFALSTVLIRSYVASRQLFAEVGDLLERAVDGRGTREPAFQARAARLGWGLTQETQLLLVSAQDEKVGLEIGAIRSLERDLKRIHPDFMIGPIRQQIIVSIASQKYTPRLKQVLASAVEKIVRWQTGHPAIIIEGPKISGIEELSKGFSSCLRTLALARMFKRTGLIQEADFGPYALLISALDDHAVPGFVAQTVGAIKAYDLKHGTELLRTSHIFIELNCRHQKAAEALGIHVSTLRYRIARVQSVFGIDLRCAETRFALGLAMRLDGMAGGS